LHRSLLIDDQVGQGTSKNFRELAEPAISAWRKSGMIGCAANSSRQLPGSNPKAEIIALAVRRLEL
jgi:hypothetical protein